MATRRPGAGGPEEGSPEYRWLYGEGSGSDQTSQAPRADETRVMRTSPSGRTTPPATQRPSERPVPPAAPPAAPDRPGRGRRGGRGGGGRRVWRVVKVLLLLWLVFLVAVPVLAWREVSKVEAFGEDRLGSQPGTTYLLVGSDSREGLTKAERRRLGTGNAGGRRTDTIMLLQDGSGPNVLTSIPRDSLVDIPGRGRNKINAAYAWGGAPLLVETVEKNTGVQVDHYVEIGFGGFVGMVDAVGGIEICPKAAMKDPQAKLDIEAGCQEADGPTALGYARSRKTYKQLGDVDRARAQREVVSAVGREALSPWTLLNPKRYYDVAMASATSFSVSEGSSPFSMARFAWAMTRLDGDSGMTCGVPIRDLAVTWDPERSKTYFAHLKADDTENLPKELCTPSGLPE
ncbi:LCP family protein [Nocardioides sp. Y6]|uniref:LCP family protein n=1 Tax=Nocardioides malaquae TaxID=2773426 RepID=A0ABR9RPF9_9ACTN|nr:LCP family protein [Nocardioides malaquae]MBE7323438.1 LCP family protein [Nocardioides malaquae]